MKMLNVRYRARREQAVAQIRRAGFSARSHTELRQPVLWLHNLYRKVLGILK